MRQNVRTQIESLVEDLLKRCDIIEPPIDVEKIARLLKIPVRYELLPEAISGFLLDDNDDTRTIVVNKKHPRQRQRFTIAHEIGHFALGHDTDQVHVEKDYTIALRLDDKAAKRALFRKKSHAAPGETRERAEVHANTFAAALLMPKSMIRTDLKNAIHLGEFDDSLIDELTERYEVSSRALLIQLNTLHLTPAFLP
jgi:Zn-dependent peptidase ImmA (M78 family)